jgi:ABC-type branched-subunit amino acid transport system permease subunit
MTDWRLKLEMKYRTHNVKKLNRKRVLICLVVFFALLPVFSYLHEAGHALVCLVDGNEPEISVDIFSGGTTFCHGDVSNLFAYKISGGLLAGIIGTIVGITLFRWKIPFIAFTTIGVGHLVNACIETYADSYFTHGNEWSAFLGFIEVVVFLCLLIIFDRKTVKQNNVL